MNYEEEKLLRLLENLFNPINNKDYGKYWNVSNNKTEALANAEELLAYIRRESKEGSFINRYANLTSDLILENNIYLDFDLTNNEYLKAEESLTLKVLEGLATTNLEVAEDVKSNVKANNEFLKQIQQKYKKAYTVENGFKKGFNSFIDSLTTAEEGALTKLVKVKEKEEVKGLSEKEIQKYYLDKFEQDYLKEPYVETLAVANYFESIGVKTIVNFSGSKGLHLRIPITEISFSEVPELAENPEAVKIFLEKLAELIETKILEKPYKKSCLDYAVFKKGMQRIPTSKHEKTKLYANFIEPSVKYLEAIDYLEAKLPVYIPEEVDLEENTSTFLESDIYKATIKKATEEATKTFKSEEANPNYKFNGKHKELLNIISKVYLPSCRNEVGFRIVHLLRRSNFSQEEVEAIFKELHEDIKDYKETIEGSIVHAYKTEKLVGLRSLIKWLNTNASAEVKEEVVAYFKKKFNYYEAPVEKVLEDVLLIHEKEYNLTEVTTSKKKYYILKDVEDKGNNLEIDKEKAVVYFRKKKRIIAKLELKTIEGKATEGLVASSKEKLNKFKATIERKTGIAKSIVEEAITELDSYFTYLEEVEEQEEQLQEQEEEIDSVLAEEEDVILFGFNGKEYNFIQKTEGIFKIKRTKKGTVLVPVANCYFMNVEIVENQLNNLTDVPLKKYETEYNVTYYNLTKDKLKEFNNLTFEELVKEIKKDKVFYIHEAIETVLNYFIIEGAIEGRIENISEINLEGYFLINNKVVENTKLKNLRYTKQELQEAILLLNEIMASRSKEGIKNDSAVYRFMLWNPFSFCNKQVGYGDSNYSLILIGKSQTNKTGASKVGNLFYNHVEEETSGSTVSVLGSKLGENTFISIFDECSHLFTLKEAENVMKRLVYEFTARATKDRTDNTKIDVFNALGLAMFLLNERIEFKDYITNRYKIIDYTDKSYISSEAKAEFNKKYVPKTPTTKLKKLAVIGKAFSKRYKAILENPSEWNRLYNIEELTIELLKEIEEEAEVNFLPEMLETTETSDKYNYNIRTEVIKLLNAEFKSKNNITANNTATGYTFTQSAINNDFDFITYNKFRTKDNEEKEFLIKAKGLEDYVNNHVEETVTLETILDYLDLTEVLEEKLKAEKYSKDYSSYIRKQNYIKVEGTKKGTYKDKNIKGFFLTLEEIANKLFSFNIDFSEKNTS